jgi:hypothetical protein
LVAGIAAEVDDAARWTGAVETAGRRGDCASARGGGATGETPAGATADSAASTVSTASYEAAAMKVPVIERCTRRPDVAASVEDSDTSTGGIGTSSTMHPDRDAVDSTGPGVAGA